MNVQTYVPGTPPQSTSGVRVLGVVNGNGQFIGATEAEREGFKILSKFLANRKSDQPAEIKFDQSLKKSVGVYAELDGQSQQELNEADDRTMFDDDIVTPPYTYALLDDLLYKNVTHNSCVETKAGDYAYHGWELMVRPEAQGIDKKTLDTARIEAEKFLKSCVDGILPIEDLVRDLALDFESIGNCAFEVIRNKEWLVTRLNHVPAHTVRVRKNALSSVGGQHFVQSRFNKKRYFMPLGGTVTLKNNFDPLTANLDEFPPLKSRASFITGNKVQFSRDAPDENVPLRNIKMAATEMFWMTRPPRSRSTVYGTPAGAAAYRAMLGEMRADWYNLAYFNSKGVPQFAVIMENPNPVYSMGAPPRQDGDTDPAAAAAAAIEEFFAKKLKTADRNVLVMEAVGGTKIRFEKLSPETIDKAMIEYSEACRESIRLAHRVPPAALGIIQAANLGSGRESSQMLRYRNHIVTPGQRIFASVVNTILRVGLLIPYFDFRFHLMPVDDEQDRREFKLKEFTEGAITPNEYRKETKRSSFSKEDEYGGIGNSLIIRNAQIALASPDGTITTTKPGDGAGTDTGTQDLGTVTNPVAPNDVGQ